MIGYIYTLKCPLTNSIIYVGATTKDLNLRLRQHVSDSVNYNSSIYKYIRKNGILPLIELLDEVRFKDVNRLRELEFYWIDQLRQWGFCLYNSSGNLTVRDVEFCDDVQEPCVTVKISSSILDMVRRHKDKTGIPVSFFYREGYL